MIDKRIDERTLASPWAMRIGTRGSALAMWQARAVRDQLRHAFSERTFELRIIRSEGDIDKTSPLTKIGGRGVFASALQAQLLDGAIDLAVHSTKDLPTLSPAGLTIAAFPEREDARDVVISRHGVGLADLPRAPRIGTSSRRRAVQIRALRPDAEIVELRGNIDTRLRKAATDDYDAVILAAAGLARMGWTDRIGAYLALDECTPSPGQGALAIETRVPPDAAAAVAASLDLPHVSAAVRLEREFLRQIGGGCTTAIGAHVEIDTAHGRSIVRIWAMLASEDGSRLERVYDEFDSDVAERSIASLARMMMRATTIAPASGVDIRQTLSRRHALTTGTPRLAASLAEAFDRAGAATTYAQVLDIAEAPIDTDFARIGAGVDDWVVVTSANAIPALTRLLEGRSPMHRPRIAVVGRRTVQHVLDAGFSVDLVPDDQRVAGLVTALGTIELRGRRAVLLLGNRAGDALERAMHQAGAEVVRVEAYRTTTIEAVDPAVREQVRQGRIDIVTFASPSAVTGLREILGVDFAALSGACMVAIGPTTAATMTRIGMPVHAMATSPTAKNIVGAAERYFEGADREDAAVEESPA